MKEKPFIVGRTAPVPMTLASAQGVLFESATTVFDHVAFSADEVNWTREDLGLEELMLERRAEQYAALARPVQWYFERLADCQPHSYRALAAMKPRLFVGERFIDSTRESRRVSTSDLLLDLGSRVVQFDPDPIGEGYCERMKFDEWLSLPEGIARSWLWRTTGWRLPREIPCAPMVYRQMVSTITKGVNDILLSYGLKKAQVERRMAELVSEFPDICPSQSSRRYELRCFLDTRPMGVNGPVGDQFFTRSLMRDGTVYHIRNGDHERLRVLIDPVEAIDLYHEHLLLKKPGEFDFSAWSRPL